MLNIIEKYLFSLFIIIFILSISGVYTIMDKYAQNEIDKRFETVLEQHKALHSYIENVQKPVIYDLKSKGILYQQWFDPKLLSFTYIARNIHDIYQSHSDENAYIYRLASNNPRNPVNQSTPFEKEILNRFNNREIDEYHKFISENNRNYFYKAIPIAPNQESCMQCHSTPQVAPQDMVSMYGNGGYNEKVGDIRALISLKIPITELYKDAKQYFFISSVMIFILLTLFYFFVRNIFKQQRLLQEAIRVNTQKDMLLAQQTKMVALGEMIGNVAHQWRQPLSLISSIATGSKLEKEFGTLTDEMFDKYMDQINDTAQQMSKTIDDFRGFLQHDAEEVTFNLSEEINNCLKIEDGVIKQNHLNIIRDFDDSIDLTNYPHALSQSLVNIINNARDAMQSLNDEDKIIQLTTKKETSDVTISIQDNGGGISEEYITKIFEPYFTTKHRSQGTGLGLHMTYQIITETMRGDITVENEAFTYNDKEYFGAKFTITLPLDN